MYLIQLVCALSIFGLYIAIGATFCKYPFYMVLLCRKPTRKPSAKQRFSVYRVAITKLAPAYRETYFGYTAFAIMIGEDMIPLYPHDKLRVYGLIHPWSKCVFTHKGDVIKTIINLEDSEFSDTIWKFFEKVYSIVITIIFGGVLLWQICLGFMTFLPTLPA